MCNFIVFFFQDLRLVLPLVKLSSLRPSACHAWWISTQLRTLRTGKVKWWHFSQTLRFLRVHGVARQRKVTPGQETCMDRTMRMVHCFGRECLLQQDCQVRGSTGSWDMAAKLQNKNHSI